MTEFVLTLLPSVLHRIPCSLPVTAGYDYDGFTRPSYMAAYRLNWV